MVGSSLITATPGDTVEVGVTLWLTLKDRVNLDVEGSCCVYQIETGVYFIVLIIYQENYLCVLKIR